VGEVSMTRSVVEGVMIRDFGYRSRRGNDIHHHLETVLATDGIPAREGDRFVVPASDVVNALHAGRKAMTRTCNGQIEFI
jgi:hypothetical protein